MKKIILVILAVVMLMGVVGCTSANSNVEEVDNTRELDSYDMRELAEQQAVNHCCREDGVHSVSGFEAPTITYKDKGDYFTMQVKGSWYREDEYGNSLGKYNFEYSGKVNKTYEESDYFGNFYDFYDEEFDCWKA